FRTLDGLDRGATARCSFGYYDGVDLKFIDGSLDGTIAMSPKGDGGYGWDKIFIPEGYDITRAEMSEAEDERTYQIIKPFDKLRKFLDTLPQT
ncbi:MAG: non-canonical purine NTP pyrophosphatase, partial [Candidatus Saccharibacteria bacterium]